MLPAAPVADALDPSRVPAHVAWVASGSRRWAERTGLGSQGLAEASDGALLELVRGALDMGVRWLTVCVAATDPVAGHLATWPERFGPRVRGEGVAVRLLGPAGATAVAGGPSAATSGGGPALVVSVTAGYSGRSEIVHAVERLAAEGVEPTAVDEAAVAARLYAPDMPDPDLVVRGGGDRRISDLLLWEIAYSELVFVDDPWPETRRAHLLDAVLAFQRRDRRYGGLAAATGRR